MEGLLLYVQRWLGLNAAAKEAAGSARSMQRKWDKLEETLEALLADPGAECEALDLFRARYESSKSGIIAPLLSAVRAEEKQRAAEKAARIAMVQVPFKPRVLA